MNSSKKNWWAGRNLTTFLSSCEVDALRVWVYEGEGCFQTPHAYRARYA